MNVAEQKRKFADSSITGGRAQSVLGHGAVSCGSRCGFERVEHACGRKPRQELGSTSIATMHASCGCFIPPVSFGRAPMHDIMTSLSVSSCITSLQVASLTARPQTRTAGSTSSLCWTTALQQQKQQQLATWASQRRSSTSSLHVGSQSCSSCRKGRIGWRHSRPACSRSRLVTVFSTQQQLQCLLPQLLTAHHHHHHQQQQQAVPLLMLLTRALASSVCVMRR